MRPLSNLGSGIATALLACAVAALGGCVSPDDKADWTAPVTHYERYPIAVKKGGVTLEVPASRGLSAANEEKVLRLAHLARGNSAGAVIVSRPSGGGGRAAGEVTRALVRGGVPADGIVHRTHGGRASVLVSYTRTYAATRACGDWSDDLTVTPNNEVYSNFGCAQQQNIAAMVANPEDLALPETVTPSDPMRRQKVFTDYREPKSPATPSDDAAKSEIAEVAQ